MMGIATAGRVVVFPNAGWTSKELAYAVNDSGVKKDLRMAHVRKDLRLEYAAKA